MEAKNDKWRRSATGDFWNGIGPGDHVVQIYDNDHTYLNFLEGFVAAGFAANDCVLVIATEKHLNSLENRLRFKGYNVFELKLQDQYVALDARETLAEFMINNWPDEVLFAHVMSQHIAKAGSKKRKVRVFGEMVSILWVEGNRGATVQLEHLWDKMCKRETLSLFCAYPQSIIPQSTLESIFDICEIDPQLIKLPKDSNHEILYQDIQYRNNQAQAS